MACLFHIKAAHGASTVLLFIQVHILIYTCDDLGLVSYALYSIIPLFNEPQYAIKWGLLSDESQ